MEGNYHGISGESNIIDLTPALAIRSCSSSSSTLTSDPARDRFQSSRVLPGPDIDRAGRAEEPANGGKVLVKAGSHRFLVLSSGIRSAFLSCHHYVLSEELKGNEGDLNGTRRQS